jgi:hypothetical protein
VEPRLLDILTIALCAIISGANERVAMEAHGNAKCAWQSRKQIDT